MARNGVVRGTSWRPVSSPKDGRPEAWPPGQPTGKRSDPQIRMFYIIPREPRSNLSNPRPGPTSLGRPPRKHRAWLRVGQSCRRSVQNDAESPNAEISAPPSDCPRAGGSSTGPYACSENLAVKRIPKGGSINKQRSVDNPLDDHNLCPNLAHHPHLNSGAYSSPPPGTRLDIPK